ncbi:hypothetical protein, partial [Staphylococcus aureus]|uniref:hypothetical protein n=1 Tax=Staphylococcus aureus TaxID=1280 RepID=UPI00301BD5AB
MKIGNYLVALGLAMLLASPLAAETRWPSEGWEVESTPLGYAALLSDLKEAVEAEGMFVVTE